MAELVEAKPVIGVTSSTGDRFEIDEDVARQSYYFSEMLDTQGDEREDIAVVTITSKILAMTISYLVEYKVRPYRDISAPLQTSNLSTVLTPFYSKFVNVDVDTLLDLTVAAHFLQIESLKKLIVIAFAALFRDKEFEGICEVFGVTGIKRPTVEELEQIRNENPEYFAD